MIEIIACSVADARAAQEGGANRLELCSAYELGGLTPSYSLFEAVRESCQLPIAVLVRPRPGGFIYSETEFQLLRKDVEWFAKNGADAIVCGVASDSGLDLDIERMRLLRGVAHGKSLVCHRCFDVCQEPFFVIEQLIQLGFQRVLTSGQKKDALAGLDLISQIQAKYGREIEVLPAGGIRESNVAELVRATEVTQIHASAFNRSTTETNTEVSFGDHLWVDRSKVTALVSAFQKEAAP